MKKTKPRSQGQRAFNRDFRGTPKTPTHRTPAPLPPLTAAERAQELAEERRMRDNWRTRHPDGAGFRGV